MSTDVLDELAHDAPARDNKLRPNARRAPSDSGSGHSSSSRTAPPRTSQWMMQLKSGRAHHGDGTLRQITYFPIESRPNHAAPPENCPWAAMATRVYRRYSECVQLRRYLVLKYSSEIVPPLLPKTTTDVFNTAMCEGNTLETQKVLLNFFFERLSENLTLYRYDTLVAAFMQLPRDDRDNINGPPEVGLQGGVHSFASLTATKSAIDSAIKEMERDLDKTDPDVFGNQTSAAMTGAVRGAAQAISNWWSRGSLRADDSGAPSEEEVRQAVNSDSGFQEWMKVRGVFALELTRMQVLAESAKKVHECAVEQHSDELAVSTAIERLADTLAKEDAEKPLCDLAGMLSDISSTRVSPSKIMVALSKHTMHFFVFESCCIEAIIETISLLLNRYRKFAHMRLNRIDRLSEAQKTAYESKLRSQARNLSEGLKVWASSLRARILLLAKMRAERMRGTLGDSVAALLASPLAQRMQREDYLAVE